MVESALLPAEEIPVDEEPLGQIGDYEILERIAIGGMGAIYRARQRGLDREVAIKLIPEGKLAGGSDVARFQLEAGAAAELDHPNIVPIYDIGEEDGQHYFSMRLLRGGTLEERVGDFHAARPAAEMMRKIAAAVHFAHQRGILHRDLKPANIFMTEAGEPMVGDFGLAKRIDSGAGAVSLTQTGQMLGSPAYIAPEIAAGKARASVSSDVYSLGVVLFQLLVGKVPFSGETQLDVIRQAVDREPPRPRSLDSGVPRDLETICLKCLEKDPAHRYPSAGELASDLGRFLGGEAIAARPAGYFERGLKWARRRPALAALGVVSLLALCGIFVILLVSSAKIRAERDLAIAEGRRARLEAYSSDMVAAFDALEDSNLFKARELVERQRPAPGAEDLRDVAWRIAWGHCRGGEARSMDGHSGGVTCLEFSPNGKQLYSGSAQERRLSIWDLASGEELTRLPRDLKVDLLYRARREAFAALGRPSGEHSERIRNTGADAGLPISLAFLNRGTHLAIGSLNSYVRIVDLEKMQLDGWWPERTGRLAGLPMQEIVLVGSGTDALGTDGVSRVYDYTKPGEDDAMQELQNSGGYVVASHDGHAIASGADDGHVTVYDSELRIKARKPYFGSVQALGLRNHGTCVVSAQRGSHEIDFWNVVDDEKTKLSGHNGTIHSLSYSPDGRVFASGSADQTICIWHATNGGMQRILKGHTGVVSSLLWSPDGKTLISGGGDGCIKFWDMASIPRVPGWRGINAPSDVSADGEWIVGTNTAATQAFSGRVVDGSGLVSAELGGEILKIGFCGERVGVLLRPRGGKSTVLQLDRNTLQPVAEAIAVGDATKCAFSPDGTRFALGFEPEQRRFELWDVKKRECIGDCHDSSRPCGFNYMEFTPDGNRIICREWNDGGSAHIYDGKNGQRVAVFETGDGSGLAISPGGNQFAIGRTDNSIDVWDIEKNERVAHLTGHLYPVFVVTWSPDGKCLASAAGAGSVRLWHLPTGRGLGSLTSNRPFRFLKFGPRGDSLIAMAYGAELEVWPIPTFGEAQDGY